jgi:hypothetical protein
VKFSPANWTTSVASFGLRHLDERLKAGDRPATVDERATAIMQVSSALTEVNKKIPVAERAPLEALARPVLTALQ